MSYGRVVKMDNGWVKTPNEGTLMDLETGLKYKFMREGTEGVLMAWNVKMYDIVSFIISGSNATGVALDKKHINGVVYSYTSEVSYTTVSDGLIQYRKGVRDNVYVIDRSADGGTTWVLGIVQMDPNEDSIIINIDEGVTGYRHLVRATAYCIDEELTALGFSGSEGLDWQNIYNTNIP